MRGPPVGPVRLRLRSMDFLTKARAGDLHLNHQVRDVGAVASQPDVVLEIEQEQGEAGPFPGAHVDTGEDGFGQQDVFLDCQEGDHEPGEVGEVTARARGDKMFSLSPTNTVFIFQVSQSEPKTKPLSWNS